MKKYLIFVLGTITSYTSNAQYNTRKDTLTYEAGRELVTFHRITSTGTGLMLFGGVLTAIGYSSKQQNLGLKVGGIAMSAIGTVMTLSASRHVGNAGQILMYLSGKPIPIRNKKHHKS